MTQAIRKALKGGKANGGKAGAGGAAGRFSVDMAAGSDRPRFSDKAKATGGKAGTPAPITVKLTAQQLTQLQRGKQIQIDLDAYHGAGGKGSK